MLQFRSSASLRWTMCGTSKTKKTILLWRSRTRSLTFASCSWSSRTIHVWLACWSNSTSTFRNSKMEAKLTNIAIFIWGRWGRAILKSSSHSWDPISTSRTKFASKSIVGCRMRTVTKTWTYKRSVYRIVSTFRASFWTWLCMRIQNWSAIAFNCSSHCTARNWRLTSWQVRFKFCKRNKRLRPSMHAI